MRYLDLSHNNFSGRIPSFIGSMTSLEYLNLSYTGFRGIIPHTVGNLSNLHTLSLADDYHLAESPLEWLSGLSQLEYLDMKGVNLREASASWVQVINALPYLVELRFKNCSLNLIVDPLMKDVNVSSSLAILDLSHNQFHSVVPRWIFQLSNLTFLDLSNSSFEGPIPSITYTTKLQYIDLSINSFNSTIPDWLYFCRDLQHVSFMKNSLHGTISNDIGNLRSLNFLSLGSNKLSGKIPNEITSLDTLQRLHLEHNSLYGVIPTSLGKLLSLVVLDLNGNKLSGNLPESLGELSNLEYLSIGGNNLEGFVTQSHFANLTKLRNLFATESHQLSLKVNPNWIPPFQLESLWLSSWDLGIQFPPWLVTQRNLIDLYLSVNGISGQVPSWLWGIQILSLSDNLLQGEIPDLHGRELQLDLGSNQFSGLLPRVANTMIALDLSNNLFSGGLSHFLCESMTNETKKLEILFLEGNRLAGELPDCFMNWPLLRILDLRNNNLSGPIPNSIGFLTNLLSLSMHNNKFSGRIPFSMHNCARLVKIDLAHNNLEGNIPTWRGTSLPNLRILILRSNKLSGKISSDICQLNYLKILDLANNLISGMIPGCVHNFTAMAIREMEFVMETHKGNGSYIWFFPERASVFIKGREFDYGSILRLVTSIDISNNNLSGDIPKELTSLVELKSLNLSGNHLTGLIPDSIGDMKQLESLDFSRNCLFGGIPNSFTTMSFLSYFNLSFNNLTGRIPESTQLQTLDASSFTGNQLCGPPLTRHCRNSTDEANRQGYKKENESDESEVEWFYVFVSSGYAVGFCLVCITLIFKNQWREAYFGFSEYVWDRVYVFLCIKWRRITN